MTSLITLKVMLEDTNKISIVIDLKINNKIKQLEAEKTDELELLEEELRIMTLRNRFLGRPKQNRRRNRLKKQTKKKIDHIEELKEVLKWEILQDLNYAKNDEIVEFAKIELKLKRLGVSKKSVNFFKKSIIPKEHLRLVLQAKNKSV